MPVKKAFQFHQKSGRGIVSILLGQDLASLEIAGLEDCLPVEVGKGRLFKAKVLVRLLSFYK